MPFRFLKPSLVLFAMMACWSTGCLRPADQAGLDSRTPYCQKVVNGGDGPSDGKHAATGGSTPADVLRDTAELVLQQDKSQNYWTQRTLLEIGDLQILAEDFDGALRSLRGSNYEYGRNEGLLHLAEALARAGKRDRASETLRLLGSSHGWSQDALEDGVQLRWFEHLIASGDLENAGKGIEQLKLGNYRSDGRRELALAYGKSGDVARAAEQIALALTAAAEAKQEFDHAQVIWKAADAQVSMGDVAAAMGTVHLLADTIEFHDPWTKVAALREAAVVAAKAKDGPTAHRLFGRAVEAQKVVDEMNKAPALKLIAMAEASVGYFEEAEKTASMIEHSDEDFTRDAYREEAACSIAIAKVKAHDVKGAIRTALSIEHFVQYRDDALHAVIDYQIAKGDLKSALATGAKFYNASRKAAALLEVASAYAKAGDRKTAADVAVGIELTERGGFDFPGIARKGPFDYRLPRTWGVCYGFGSSHTMLSHQAAVQQAQEVAGAAMAFSLAMGTKPDESYAVLFNDIRQKEVTRALARAQAVSGETGEALAWARQIGSGGLVATTEDHDTLWAVERRVYALMGVAQGMLERSGKGVPESGR